MLALKRLPDVFA